MRRWKLPAGLVFFGVAYYALSRFGIALTFPTAAASTFWPAAGLAAGVLTMSPRRVWPAFLAVLAAANVLGNLAGGFSVASGLAFAVADAVEAVAAASIILAIGRGVRFLTTLRSALAMIVGSTAGILGGFLGTLLLGWAGELGPGSSFVAQWRGYAVGDIAGMLVMTPLVVVLLGGDLHTMRPRPSAKLVEAAAVVAALAVSIGFVFGRDLGAADTITFLPILTLLPLLWMAVRFDPRLGAVVCAIASVAIVWLTSRGLGPFGVSGPLGVDTEIALVQGFLAVVICTTLILAAVMEERRELTRSLGIRNEALERAVEGIAHLDADLCYESANAAFARMVGRDPETLRGLPFVDTVDAVWAPALAHVIRHAQEDGKAGVEASVSGTSGHRRHVEITVVAGRHEDGDGNLFVFAKDVTERQRYQQQLAHRSLHDELTGLANRRLLNDRLERAVRRRDRFGTEIAVLFLDIDRFKIVNDSLGHDVGDMILEEVAARLGQVLGSTDTVARFGGDEFVVLLEDLPDSESAAQTARRLDAVLREPFQIRGTEVFLTASVGIVLSRAPTLGPADLLRHADWAMYRAKESGRGRHEVFDDSLEVSVRRRVETESELRRGVDRDELAVFYQPIVSMVDDRVARCEALVRWNRPGHEFVNAAWFVGMAEESNLIVKIGEWVLDAAARQAVRWRSSWEERAPVVHANVSAKQLGLPNFARVVERILDTAECEPEWLSLEITETALMLDMPSCVAALTAVSEMGVGLCIDDFGTGYATLGHLRHFPIDAVKLAMSLVQDVELEPVQAIVRAIVQLAEDLGADVVAEGVETDAALDRLAFLGCHLAQGYLFGKPAPATEITIPAVATRVSGARAAKPAVVSGDRRPPPGAGG